MLLQNFQTEFAELIFNEEASSDFISPSQHILIYRHHVIANLINTLKDIYPLIVKIVGNDFFHTTAMEYINRYPSRSSNLHDFGEYFSDFLTEYKPVSHLIYLTEIAEFEWRSHLLYFAADHSPLDINFLKDVSPHQYDHLHFVLHPASFLKQFRYPILRIIDLCKNEIDAAVDIREGGINLLMIRRDLDIMLAQLQPAEFAFLEAISAHKSLSESLQIAANIDPQFNLIEKLPAWIHDKTIVDCYFE